MFANKGDGFLPQPLAHALTSGQLTDAQRAASNDFVGYFTENTWGFGGGIVVGNDPSGAPHTYGWDSGLGSALRVDPARGKITVLLSNRGFTSPKPPPHVADFWKATRA